MNFCLGALWYLASMLQVPRLRHRELGEMEPEEENLPPSTPRVPNRAPDELWEVEGVCEDTVPGQEILADHSDPLWVLRGHRGWLAHAPGRQHVI